MAAAGAPVRWPTVAHEGRPAAIDQRVHHLQRRDLAAQPMGADRRLDTSRCSARREVAQQLALEQRIVGQVGVEDLVVRSILA